MENVESLESIETPKRNTIYVLPDGSMHIVTSLNPVVFKQIGGTGENTTQQTVSIIPATYTNDNIQPSDFYEVPELGMNYNAIVDVSASILESVDFSALYIHDPEVDSYDYFRFQRFQICLDWKRLYELRENFRDGSLLADYTFKLSNLPNETNIDDIPIYVTQDMGNFILLDWFTTTTTTTDSMLLENINYNPYFFNVYANIIIISNVLYIELRMKGNDTTWDEINTLITQAEQYFNSKFYVCGNVPHVSSSNSQSNQGTVDLTEVNQRIGTLEQSVTQIQQSITQLQRADSILSQDIDDYINDKEDELNQRLETIEQRLTTLENA